MDDDQPTGVTPPARPEEGSGASARSRARTRSSGGSGSGGRSRGSTSRGSGGAKGGGGAAGLLQQRGVRIVLGVVLAVILVLVVTLLVQSCRRNQLVDSYKSFLTGATQITGDSAKQGARLQEVLANQQGEKPADLQTKVKSLQGQAERLVERAEDLDPPGKLEAPNQSLILALKYRATGLGLLAEAIPSVVESKNAAFASATLAAPMQRFVAGDVIFQDSFVGPAKRALTDDDVTGIQVPERDLFLPGALTNQASPSGAAELIPSLKRTGGGATNPDGTPAAGLHGMGLVSTEALPEGTVLEAGVTTTLQASEQLQWKVTAKNQGDFQESGVVVRAVFTSPGEKDQVVEAEIETIAPDEETSVTLPGPKSPTFGEESSLKIEVVPVADEGRTENNRAEYPVKIVF